METNARPSPASQAKTWIITIAVVLMAAPFVLLGLRPTAATPAKQRSVSYVMS